MLLVRRVEEPGRGLWTLPGGTVHPGKELEDARWVEIADLSHYRMTRGTADLIRRPLARQEDGLQCHGG